MDGGEDEDGEKGGWFGFKVTNEPNIQSVLPPVQPPPPDL